MMRKTTKAICLIALGAAILTAGCARTPPTRFYLLSSGPEAVQAAPGAMRVAVSAVQIPDYLDRPQIVTRSGANAVELAEYDRWAEPLDRNLTRVLIDHLSARDGFFAVSASRGQTAGRRVSVEVLAMDGALDKPVRLRAHWVISGENLPAAVEGVFDQSSPGAPGDYDTMAAQYSALTAGLASGIADALEGGAR